LDTPTGIHTRLSTTNANRWVVSHYPKNKITGEIMHTHTAKNLFNQNIQSAKDSLALYDAIVALQPKGVDINWVLRSAVVFAVSALDTFFHDKIKYRVGRYDLSNLPPALGKFEIEIKELTAWDSATRKGDVLQNWVTNYLSTRPLQSRTAIEESLKMAGINAVWDTIEPDKDNKNALLRDLDLLVKRRNQISHEGDRMTSRRSGKALRPITRLEVENWIKFVEDLVLKVENAFPG
jgi:restriction system protein